MSTRLTRDWQEKAEDNVREHGTQHPETLLAAIEEEAGEVARAYLDATYFDEADQRDLTREIDDLAALLVQLRWAVEDHPMAFEPLPTAEEIVGDPDSGDESGPSTPGTSERDRRRQVRDVIGDQGGTTAEEVVDIMEMGAEEIEHHIEVLEQRGQIYEFEGELRKS